MLDSTGMYSPTCVIVPSTYFVLVVHPTSASAISITNVLISSPGYIRPQATAFPLSVRVPSQISFRPSISRLRISDTPSPCRQSSQPLLSTPRVQPVSLSPLLFRLRHIRQAFCCWVGAISIESSFYIHPYFAMLSTVCCVGINVPVTSLYPCLPSSR